MDGLAEDHKAGQVRLMPTPEVVEAARHCLARLLGHNFTDNGLYDEMLVAEDVAQAVLDASIGHKPASGVLGGH